MYNLVYVFKFLDLINAKTTVNVFSKILAKKTWFWWNSRTVIKNMPSQIHEKIIFKMFFIFFVTTYQYSIRIVHSTIMNNKRKAWMGFFNSSGMSSLSFTGYLNLLLLMDWMRLWALLQLINKFFFYA